jgi:hypothetical protein
MGGPVPDQFNLVVSDMEASVAFYRRLAVAIADNAREVPAPSPDCTTCQQVELDLDSAESARHWDHGWSGGMGVLGFKLDRRDRVEEICTDRPTVASALRTLPMVPTSGVSWQATDAPDRRLSCAN